MESKNIAPFLRYHSKGVDGENLGHAYKIVTDFDNQLRNTYFINYYPQIKTVIQLIQEIVQEIHRDLRDYEERNY